MSFKSEFQTALIDSYVQLNAKPIVNGHMTIPANQNCLVFELGDLDFGLEKLHLLESFS